MESSVRPNRTKTSDPHWALWFVHLNGMFWSLHHVLAACCQVSPRLMDLWVSTEFLQSLSLWFAKWQCWRCEEHDWRTDRFDQHSAGIRAHADWVVYWINIRVNVVSLSFVLLACLMIAHKAIHGGSSRPTCRSVSRLLFRRLLAKISLFSSVCCGFVDRGSDDDPFVLLFAGGWYRRLG